MNLAKRIKNLRISSGLELKELAERLGVSYSSVSKYESGERLPDVYMLKTIAEFFDVSVDYLLDHKPSDKTSSLIAEDNIFYGSVDLVNKTAKLNEINSHLISFLLKLNELDIRHESLEHIYLAFKTNQENKQKE